MAGIDIGSPAINRTDTLGGQKTYIFKDNPAENDGRITSIEIWANTNLIDTKVATFYEVSAGRYSTRDWEAIGTVSSGSKQIISVNLDVQTGDLIGIYWLGELNFIERDEIGIGYLRNNLMQIPCIDAVFILDSNTASISLYGTGTTIEEVEVNAIFFGANF